MNYGLKIKLSVLASMGALVGVSHAQSNWTAGTADWSGGGNWSAGVPNGVNAVINNGGTANITSDQPNTNDLLVGRGSGTTGTVNHSVNATHNANQWQFIGVGGGSGTVNVSAGNFNQTVGAGRNTRIGDADGTGLTSTGVFSLSGSSSADWDGVSIGRDAGGSGTMNHTSSGLVSTWTTNIGVNGGAGTYTQSAGTHRPDREANIGASGGSGTYLISGGTHQSSRNTTIGNGTGSTGYVEVSGGTFRTNTGGIQTQIGNSGGAGTIIQSNGTVIFDNELYATGGGTAIDHQSGGSHTAWALTLGQDAGSNGTFTMDGGTRTYARGLILGNSNATAQGNINMNGGTLNIATGASGFSVGDEGVGVVNHTDGLVSVSGSGWVAVGLLSGSDGSYDISGGTLRTQNGDNSIFVGDRTGATGVFTMSGTSVVETGTLNVNRFGGGAGTAELEGGTLRVQALNVGSGGVIDWGGATLTHRIQFGQEGVLDYTDTSITGQPDAAGGRSVSEGNILSFSGGANADLTTGFNGGNSTLLLGDLYNNAGVKFNTLSIEGALDLSAVGDTLAAIGSPYMLRPNIGLVSDFGSLPLVNADEGIIGEFDTFVAPNADYLGFAEFTGTFTGVGALPQNTWYLEYTNNGGGADQIIFHYHVEGTVPEPGTVGLLGLGLMLMRALRKQEKYA